MTLNEQQRTLIFDDNTHNHFNYGDGVFSINSTDAIKAKVKLVQKDLIIIKFRICCLALSLLPIALIADAIEGSHCQVAVSIFKLLRLLTFWPFLQMFEYFKKKSMYTARIIENVVYYYALVHFFACLFIHITTYEDGVDVRTTWLIRVPVPQEDYAH